MMETMPSNERIDEVMRSLADAERRALVLELGDGPVPEPEGVSWIHRHLPQMEDAGVIELVDGEVRSGDMFDDALELAEVAGGR